MNNGSSWTEVNSGLTIKKIYAIAICDNMVLAGGVGGVFRSTNNGASWTKVNSGLNDSIASSFVVSGNIIFMGTWGGGVFLSTDNGITWTETNLGLGNTRIMTLLKSGNMLYAGTSCGGVWRRPVSEMTGIDKNNFKNPSTFKFAFPTRSNYQVSFRFFLPQSEQVTLTIYDLSGHRIATLVNEHFGSGTHNIYWNTHSLASGCYAARMQTGTNTYIKSIPMFR
jgi:hypothetical protein